MGKPYEAWTWNAREHFERRRGLNARLGKTVESVFIRRVRAPVNSTRRVCREFKENLLACGLQSYCTRLIENLWTGEEKKKGAIRICVCAGGKLNHKRANNSTCRGWKESIYLQYCILFDMCLLLHWTAIMWLEFWAILEKNSAVNPMPFVVF